MSIPVNLVFEDELSEYILIRLLNCFKNKYNLGYSYNGRGFGYIKSKINGFNEACKAVPFLVLTDLDKAPCPVALINNWFSRQMHPKKTNFLRTLKMKPILRKRLLHLQNFPANGL